ncbi:MULTISPECIES: cyclic nucleotide-binding domain-containing protein [Caldilinea]|uniref:Cyclic nucleotide-binding domain-containing protein n=1 Tax=Caldilinea aerophila (strain DSM 14535 / JCM 11387 / NBRC 104270 / STL-6-O1) TaxID=926550 RepID=I0I2M5_CALAS|nr:MULTISPECIES: cyclic nucleotide-binding domain-containing protein [Caldilinea]BAL99512.1 hypothetical protein CLDAP_14730 [Caldilinea aerophila DSM 14535 = NBRC 104270]GIV73893.1 MAG: hypothetical protein KatS3mg049_2449 [Caldilinea sp.]
MSMRPDFFDAKPLSSEDIKGIIGLKLNFLEGIDKDTLTAFIADAMQRMYLAPFKFLYHQDEPVTAVYILVSGRINQYRQAQKVNNGQRPRLIARTVDKGKLLGHLEFLYGIAYATHARSEEPCELLAIDARALSRLIYYYPQIRNKLFPKQVADRLSTFPFMRRLELASGLHPVVSGFLADETISRKYGPEEPIYRSGDLSEQIYLIHQGQVKLELAGHPEETHLLGNGAMFGAAQDAAGYIGIGSTDRFMLHHAISQTNTEIYAIPYHRFQSITGLDPERVMREDIRLREAVIEQLPIFSDLSLQERRAIAGYVSHFYVPHVRLLIHQGEAADSLWVLIKGHASVRALDANGNLISSATATGLTYFAEQALLGLIPQESTVEAQAGSEWLRFHWSDLEAASKHLKVNLRSRLRIKQRGRVAERPSEGKQPQYDWLEPGEIIVMRVRRHWVAFFVKNLLALLLFIIALVLYLAADWLAGFVPGSVLVSRVIIAAVLLIDLIALLWGTIDYWNDWLVITDRRVIHQEKVLFAMELRNQAQLDDIQNVDFKTTWPGKFLNYGTMTIETAASAGKITFNYATHFGELDKEIKRGRELRRRHTEAASKSSIQRTLEARLGLAVDIPSRVYRGGKTVSEKLTLRRHLEHFFRSHMRRQRGDRIIWRKHWLVLVPRLWFPLLVFLSVMLFALLPSFSEAMGAPREAAPFLRWLTILGVLATLAAFAHLIWVIADWRNDTYEVSDEEIVHVDRMPLGLSEDRKSANLGRIQNVTMSIPSPLHWLFNFGNVQCQTAAEGGSFDFVGVPEPRMVAQEILKRMENYRRRTERQAAINRAKDLPDWFEMYNRIEPEVLEERINSNG